MLRGSFSAFFQRNFGLFLEKIQKIAKFVRILECNAIFSTKSGKKLIFFHYSAKVVKMKLKYADFLLNYSIFPQKSLQIQFLSNSRLQSNSTFLLSHFFIRKCP